MPLAAVGNASTVSVIYDGLECAGDAKVGGFY